MLKSKRKSKKSKQKLSITKAPKLTKKALAVQKRKAARQKQEAVKSIATFGSIGAVIGMIFLLAGKVKIAIAGGGGAAILMLSYKYPRQALWAFLIYLPFSGTVTYWIGSGNAIFQIAKDAFYIPALIALIQNCKKKRLPFLIPKNLIPTFSIVLGLSLLTLIFANGELQLNPGRDKPILQGIIGLKVLLGYSALIPCMYYLIRNKKDLLFFTRMHLLLAIACCTLGLIQYFMLTTGKCQGTRGMTGELLFKATLTAKCFVGGSLLYSPEVNTIRLPGTFVAPWQWAWFLIANAFLTFASAFSESSFWWRMMGLGGIALVFTNAVISGQRAALIVVPAAIFILLILTGQVVNFKRFIPIGVGLAIILCIGVATNPQIVQQRWDSFVSRWNAAPPQQFLFNQFQQSHNFIDGHWLGIGLGRATNSTRFLGATQLIETYQPKLIYELGYPGAIAFQVMFLHLTFLTFKAYRSVRDRSLRIYGASFWVFIAFISINPQYYPLDVDPVAVYYWMLAGVVFKLPKIDRQIDPEKHQKIELKNLPISQQLKEKKNIDSSPI
ncbi:hormogonium polysaccharide biosynthesis protein HpsL [Kamptonema sp. UHCC 0994]|uniref:hormogonium polysaccharide biosynthesis protein HpsL n=1 Tax=Kamptonema sp. UHCC 0994 TaxID=3031329 RepID=UPI0023BAA3E8|nr:hormogonium polysaccharide biosynthesis protein HpsL [Kamptonema sp. UHCC 0994]MDF0556766.1 hormogonium polysaccharide biosynthesis protein HpsL [Kamptonema sp. UHCC 0994]